MKRDARIAAEADAAALRERTERAEQRERAAGADMAAIVNAAADYLAAMTWSPSQDPKWKPGDGIIDYKTPEKRLKKLVKGPGRPGAALLAELAAARAVVAAARCGFGTEEDIERGFAFDPNRLADAIRMYDEATKASEP